MDADPTLDVVGAGREATLGPFPSSISPRRLAVFTKGLWKENPVLRQLLGMCPTLAVTNSAVNGLSMGLATTFTVVSSGIVVSLLRRVFPRSVRIAGYTVIIATFVTIADLFLAANFPDISRNLGPYVPLIVVNCLILGRQEAFASRNPVGLSVLDTAGMGFGFTWTLVLLGTIREILGSGSVFGYAVLGLALFMVLRDYNFLEAIIFGVGARLGFTLALIIMAGIREELALADVPRPFQGGPITLITAAILALAFMGFSGMIPQ